MCFFQKQTITIQIWNKSVFSLPTRYFHLPTLYQFHSGTAIPEEGNSGIIKMHAASWPAERWGCVWRCHCEGQECGARLPWPTKSSEGNQKTTTFAFRVPAQGDGGGHCAGSWSSKYHKWQLVGEQPGTWLVDRRGGCWWEDMAEQQYFGT